MFQEFLHPELILFGTLLNPSISIHHEIATKEGELVIHQLINRQVFDPAHYPSRPQMEKLQKQIQKEKKQQEFLQEEEVDGLQPPFQREKQQDNAEESPEKQKNIQGYYENEENPYDDEYYGFNIDAQYAPEQFGSIDSKFAVDQSPAKPAQSEHVPFTEQSPAKESVGEIQNNQEEIDTENAFMAGAEEIAFGDASNDLIDELVQM